MCTWSIPALTIRLFCHTLIAQISLVELGLQFVKPAPETQKFRRPRRIFKFSNHEIVNIRWTHTLAHHVSLKIIDASLVTLLSNRRTGWILLLSRQTLKTLAERNRIPECLKSYVPNLVNWPNSARRDCTDKGSPTRLRSTPWVDG